MIKLLLLAGIIFVICVIIFILFHAVSGNFNFRKLDKELTIRHDYILPLSLAISIVLSAAIWASFLKPSELFTIEKKVIDNPIVTEKKIEDIEEPRVQEKPKIVKKENVSSPQKKESKTMLYFTSLVIFGLILVVMFGVYVSVFLFLKDLKIIRRVYSLSLFFGLISSSILWLYSPFVPDNIKLLINADHQRITKIQAKITELSDLAKKLENKYQEVNNLTADYQKGIDTLKLEIQVEKEMHKIANLEQANKNPLIVRNLSLIQRKQAYINKLNIVAGQLKIAILDIQYLQRQVEDDLKIVKVLKSEDAKKIVKQINQVMEKYLPQAGEMPVIEIDEKALPSLEQIWQEIK